jgi:hypothetical protein
MNDAPPMVFRERNNALRSSTLQWFTPPGAVGPASV